MLQGQALRMRRQQGVLHAIVALHANTMTQQAAAGQGKAQYSMSLAHAVDTSPKHAFYSFCSAESAPSAHLLRSFSFTDKPHTTLLTPSAYLLQAGIDLGEVHCRVNPATGRMTYIGKVMNRAARNSNCATSSQVGPATSVQYS